ncbi:MAG: Lrp/AsnC family transcriptional regulator [bacterium]|nr:Lrp/AsnC family transcriptional regulator [bacterium]
MNDFNKNEAAVLNAIQQTISFVERPFEQIGSEAGIAESEVVETIRGLKEKGVIRNIAGIFNGTSLGYYLSLVALEVPEDAMEMAAAVINSHPGVSHNYQRGDRYNTWFTLAEENEETFNKSVEVIAQKTGAKDCLVLQNEKLLKIGVMLPVGSEKEKKGDSRTPKDYAQAKARTFTEEEKETIRLLQTDLPVCEEPFKKLLEESKSFLTQERFLELSESLRRERVMRRYAAVLRHREAGYTVNAMTVWKCSDEQTQPFVDESSITHLYLRTIYPGRWEYPLFAMIHARSEEDLSGILTGLAQKTGIEDYRVLRTLREFKKERVTYFSKEFTEWRNKNYD